MISSSARTGDVTDLASTVQELELVGPSSAPAEPCRLRYEGSRRHGKRALDIAVVLASLPVLLPMMAALAVIVTLDSAGPVLFRQERVGQRERTFRMLKFRTMVVDAEDRLRSDPELHRLYLANDHKLPPDLDPRLTRAGRWLRRTSLDELPQLFNVLAGQMSLVGPRPVTPEQLDEWGNGGEWYLRAKPGITGLWQINGRSGIKADDRLEYDRVYLVRWSLWLDVKVLAMTPIAVLSARGAH